MDDKKQSEIPINWAQTKRLRELFGLWFARITDTGAHLLRVFSTAIALASKDDTKLEKLSSGTGSLYMPLLPLVVSDIRKHAAS